MGLPVSGFMPLPIPYMIPFMAAQSMVMGDAFGRGYQMGKRRISSMSNEQFNAYTHTQLMIDLHQDIQAAIPTMKQGLSNMDEYTQFVINKLLNILPQMTKGLIQQGADDVVTVGTEFGDLGKKVFDYLKDLGQLPTAHGDSSTPYKWQAPPPPPGPLPDWMKPLHGPVQGPPDKTKERDDFIKSGKSTPLPWQDTLDKIAKHGPTATQKYVDKLKTIIASTPPATPKNQRTAKVGTKTYTYTVKGRGQRKSQSRKSTKAQAQASRVKKAKAKRQAKVDANKKRVRAATRSSPASKKYKAYRKRYG